jgi:DNA-binding CsgD family transcriptional regulator
MRLDAVSVAEVGYAIDLPEAEWIAEICKASWGAFGIGVGCTACTFAFDQSGDLADLGCFTSVAGASWQTREMSLETTRTLPRAVTELLYAPSPPTVLFSQLLGMPAQKHPNRLLAQHLSENSVWDFVGVRAAGPERRGVMLGFPVPVGFKLAPRSRRALDQVAAHLAAAYRLRCGVPDALETAAAVLTPSGRVEHQGPDADVASKRGALVDAVRRMERSRGKSRRLDAEHSLSEWRALVSGRWSVLDFIDTDGKRFIVARRNEPRGRDLLAITDVERQVLEFASFGHSSKLIAYELGLAPSTVSAHMRRGLKKLGLTHQSELVALRARGGGAGHDDGFGSR